MLPGPKYPGPNLSLGAIHSLADFFVVKSAGSQKQCVAPTIWQLREGDFNLLSRLFRNGVTFRRWSRTDPAFFIGIGLRFGSPQFVDAKITNDLGKNRSQFSSWRIPFTSLVFGHQSTKRFLDNVLAIGFIGEQPPRVPPPPHPKILKILRLKGCNVDGQISVLCFQSMAFPKPGCGQVLWLMLWPQQQPT